MAVIVIQFKFSKDIKKVWITVMRQVLNPRIHASHYTRALLCSIFTYPVNSNTVYEAMLNQAFSSIF